MGRMEHRCGSRHPLSGVVMVYARDGSSARTVLREASISGMFVEASPQLFCCNSVVDIEMTLPGTAGLRTYRWKAMVIRKTEQGIGLMFDQVRPPAITRLMASAEAGLIGTPRVAATAGNVVALRPAGEKSPQP